MIEVKCKLCGKTAAVEPLSRDRRYYKGPDEYIVRCPHCFARTKEARTELEALEKWENEDYTYETMLTRQNLNAEDMDTDAAIRLAAAITGVACEDYRIIYLDYTECARRYNAIQEQHPLCKQADDAYEDAKDKLFKAKSRRAEYKELRKAYDEANKNMEALKREYPEYWKIKDEFTSLTANRRSLERFLLNTELLEPVSVSRESLVKSLRIQALQADSDVVAKLRKGEKRNASPEVRIVFRNECWKGFITDSLYVRIEVNEADFGKSLIISSAPKKEGQKTCRAYIKGHSREIYSKRQDLVEWVGGRSTPYCKIVYDHFHKRYLIK